MSREHVVPDWIENILPRKFDYHIDIQRGLDFSEPQAVPRLTRAVNQGPIGNVKVPTVCLICNNGWMSDLQDMAMPILAPLIRGIWNDFTGQQAAVISKWAAMTVAVVADRFPNSDGVSQADRTYIRDHSDVPPNWQIWIGRASGFEDISYSNRPMFTGGLELNSVKPKSDSCITTIAIGQLIVHAINLSRPDLAPPQLLYSEIYGVFPIHPRIDPPYDWRDIPFISATSKRYQNLVHDYFLHLMGTAGPLGSLKGRAFALALRRQWSDGPALDLASIGWILPWNSSSYRLKVSFKL